MGDSRGVLAGKVALITGGSRGIGRAIAEAFAHELADVAVAARSRLELEEVAGVCRSLGVRALALELDVRDPESCRGVVSRCEAALGRIDVLVNNAGISSAQKFTAISDEIWLDTMAVNLHGPFYITKAALPGMLARRRGSVIAIDSIAGKIGGAYIAPYGASKHALLGMMRSLASEYARSGVNFNCVCPAYVDTRMTEKSIINIMEKTGRSREDALESLLTPQGRLVQPEEVAAVCVLLASEAGRGINGQAINVDGGQVPW
jgi:NAD(P)-dependent dehydrogenase (short-subunit alcohol dehydrogenase family)